ncbi:MAG: hydrogenase nickel incorporation protein HypA/HybF [Archaeoglobi archaeon]|nr:hydrogenase nickel incorporation protein HypA/HybF [Archaeoglobi archaeon]MDK2781981.1 hydrogenase nickel incorporation protein HypA/HybF [Archaeoglobi archaeon]
MAYQIYETLKNVIEERGDVKRVRRVSLEIGELTMINPEQLEFCFRAIISEDELMSSAELEIEMRKAEVECERCGKIEEPLVGIFLCPKCGGALKISRGRDLIIKSVDLEVES